MAGNVRAFLFAYSNVHADPAAPLGPDGQPTSTVNLSLGLNDVRGNIPIAVQAKLMIKISDTMAKKTIDSLNANDDI